MQKWMLTEQMLENSDKMASDPAPNDGIEMDTCDDLGIHINQ